MARHEDHLWMILGPTEKMYNAIFGRPAPLPFFSEMQVQIWKPDVGLLGLGAKGRGSTYLRADPVFLFTHPNAHG
jgi:hypothetical protein